MDKEAKRKQIALEIQQLQQRLQQVQNQQATMTRELIKKQGQVEMLDEMIEEEKTADKGKG